MPTCPVMLLNYTNGIYTYQTLDACTEMTSIRYSDTQLQLGCDQGNPDCEGTWPCPDEALVVPKPTRRSRKTAAASPRGLASKVADSGNQTVDPLLVSNGLPAILPASFVWKLPNATLDPTYQGEDAYHVVRVKGKDRFVHVVHAVTKPSPSFFVVTWRGKTPRLSAISAQEISLGQEAELPQGVKPRPMTIVETPSPGGQYHRTKRSGAGADPTVFHVLLKK